MPLDPGESVTDDLPDPPTPTASHFPQPPQEVSSPQTQPEEKEEEEAVAACCAEFIQSDSETMQMEVELEEDDNDNDGEGDETDPPPATQQSHVIRNADEIFLTIEGLMSKLHKLKVSFVSFVAPEEEPRRSGSNGSIQKY